MFIHNKYGSFGVVQPMWLNRDSQGEVHGHMIPAHIYRNTRMCLDEVNQVVDLVLAKHLHHGDTIEQFEILEEKYSLESVAIAYVFNGHHATISIPKL